MSKVKINGLILASGYSKRYGKTNKLLERYKDHTIIESVIDTVVKSELFSKVIVITQYETVEKLCYQQKEWAEIIEVINNPSPEEGISKSIRLGVMASKDVDGYMFLQGDQPLISVETLSMLVSAFKEETSRIIVPVYGDAYGSPKIFSKDFRDDLSQLHGDVGGKQLIEGHKNKVVEVVIERPYENVDIDSKKDYVELENWAK